ncbi:hypothetical protein, partial [Escherichia coli]|uniref:hypothetical protein n=1 Tax=Escherichia coli TaxID=562 RepID=UPI00226449E4
RPDTACGLQAEKTGRFSLHWRDNTRPDKALAPHPALLSNSSAAIMSDAILAHLIRPTPLVLLGAIF